jgi:putative two-component system response regulator
MNDLSARLRGIEAGADAFLAKPLSPSTLRAHIASLSRTKQLLDALDSAESAFMALAMMIESRDPDGNGHGERLARHAVALGRALGLPDTDLADLHRGGFLHDVGKVGIPDAVLLKPGPLSPDEFEVMKRHTTIGDTLCAPLQSLRRVRQIVLCHHERLDGSGYPNGLRGDDVPLLAQIVGIVDVYDALTSRRPYRGPWATDVAAQYLLDDVAHGRFAKHHVEAFLDLVGAAPSLATA